ncbi:agglutinin-like protein 5 [Lactuca sativa]|nr:agglutinin-like protein 5 [Lactuca sativa]
MANTPFLLETRFNFNPLLQQTFRLSPLRSFPTKLSSGNNHSFKLNYTPYKGIKYSSKLSIKCLMSAKPEGETGIGGNTYPDDNDLKAVAISSGININEVLCRSMQYVLTALQFPVITGVLLGLLFLYDHQFAFAASGGRMGCSSFSSSSTKSSISSSSSSSTTSKSSYPSSSSSSSSSSYKSSKSSSSSTPKSSSYSSSSSTSSTKPSSSSSSSSSWSSSSTKPETSSSSWSSKNSSSWSSSYESPKSSSSYENPKSSSSYEIPKSWYSYEIPKSSPSSSSKRPNKSSSSSPNPVKDGVEPAVVVDQAVAVEPAVGVQPAVRVDPIIAGAMIFLAVGFVAAILPRPLLAQKTSVLKLQVGLSGNIRSVQKDLNRIAEKADTSCPEGLSYILQETTRVLQRYPDYCISGYSSVDAKRSIVDVETLFNQLCIDERSKFDEETLVNVNNIRKQSATTQRPNDFNAEYIVITIVVAAGGMHKLPPINSSAKLKEALQNLATIPSSSVKAVEVLWTPQDENDTLTKQEYLEDYSLLRPL